jgi:hypothetical protein
MSDDILAYYSLENSPRKKTTVKDFIDDKIKRGELDNVLLQRIAELQSEVTRLRGALTDFVEHGTRHDLIPTICIDAKTNREYQDKLIMFFYDYIKGIDAYVVDKAKSAMKGE